MNRCPVCQARFCAETTCRRCGADLTYVMRTAARAAMLRHEAMDALAAGDLTAAEQRLDAAQTIQRSDAHRCLTKLVQMIKIMMNPCTEKSQSPERCFCADG